MTDILPYLLTLFAYLLGSVSTAIITCKIMNLPDPRTLGSKNPGATNVLRVGGKKAAFITLLGDFLKSLLPILLAKALGVEENWLVIIGIAAFLGHLYPVFYGFKGGKGVATGLGVYFGLSFFGGVAVAATWLLVAKGLKLSSLSALVATLLAPLYFYLLGSSQFVVIGLVLMTLLIYWRHRSNIQNMLQGKEDKIGKKEASEPNNNE
jgi:glycerol-3-phosphate acyltransferase PlsY